MWLRALVLAGLWVLPLAAWAQGQKPPTQGVPGSGLDLAALMKMKQQGQPGKPGAGRPPGAPQAAPNTAPKTAPAKPSTGAKSSKPGDKATTSTAMATDKDAAAAGKKAPADSAAGAVDSAADSEKIDPALLVSVPTRELPEDESPFPAVAEGELTSDRILREFQSIDANHDGALSYLEARDRSQIDLTNFRQFDGDNSGLLDTQEFESHMVLIASARGQPIERTLKTRVDNFVGKRKTQIAEEKAKAAPVDLASKIFDYYDTKLQGIASASGQPGKANIPRPPGLPPRSPRHPRLPAY